jgi:hypothetical protein
MNGDQHRGVIAQNLLEMRALRESAFPRELFDEYAWNMLLHLFVGLASNEIMTEVALCKRADVTTHAGRRWLQHLLNDGEIESRSDGDDVVLTPAAIDRMRSFLDRTGELPWTAPPASLK